MSIRRPRRIFRPSLRPTAPRGFGAALVIALVSVIVGGALAMVGMTRDLRGQMVRGARVISAPPGQVAVIDGDTLRLGAEVVRLSDVIAPPRGEPCAAGPDCGGRATAALAELVRDRRVECRVSALDGLGRPAGRCDAGGQDVNIALVATGWARADAPALSAAEGDARAHRRGIWLAD